jgi:hypothetical protein
MLKVAFAGAGASFTPYTLYKIEKVVEPGGQIIDN